MPIYGQRDNAELDRFNNFLSSVLGKETQVKAAIAQHEQTMREQKSIQDVLSPIAEAAAGKDVESPVYQDVQTSETFPSNSTTPAPVYTPPMGASIEPKAGTIAASHNNPLNLKYGDFLAAAGAKPGQAAQPGPGETPAQAGHFAMFPDVQTGIKASVDTLKGPGYRDLPVDAAMRRWSNNGYGAEVAPQELRGKKIGELSDEEMTKLVGSMAQRESGAKVNPAGAGPQIEPYGKVMERKQTGTKKEHVYPSPQDMNNLEFQGMLKLLSMGTESSRKTAETLSKFHSDQNASRTPVKRLVGEETVNLPGGGTKRIYKYSQSPDNTISDVESVDLSGSSSPEDAARLREQAAQDKELRTNVEKYRATYNNADQAVKSIEADQPDIRAQIRAAAADKDWLRLMDATDEMEGIILEGMDQAKATRYARMREYVTNLGKRSGAAKNLEGLGYGMTESGSAVTSDKLPKKKGNGYFTGSK